MNTTSGPARALIDAARHVESLSTLVAAAKAARAAVGANAVLLTLSHLDLAPTFDVRDVDTSFLHEVRVPGTFDVLSVQGLGEWLPWSETSPVFSVASLAGVDLDAVARDAITRIAFGQTVYVEEATDEPKLDLD